MKKTVSLFLSILLLIYLSACSATNNTPGKSSDMSGSGQEKDIVKEEPVRREITILTAGDIMFHNPQIKAAYTGKTYNFKPSFEEIKPIIEKADIAIGNFETTINPDKKPSGYPTFNAPVEVLDAIKYAGFDVLTTANNHAMDTGTKGLLNTVEAIKEHGMIPVGTGKKDDDKFAIVEKNGVNVAILSYTYGTNGIKAPDGMVNLIDKDKIKSDIERVKNRSDFVLVMLHTGTEYIRKVEDFQYALFREIADMGADAVIGGHPHVARKSEVYSSNGRNVFISYSMGNFISNQTAKYTDIGTMVELRVVKTDTAKIEDARVIPVYRSIIKQGGRTIHQVLPAENIDKYSDKVPVSRRSYVKQVYGELTDIKDIEVFKNR
ncbi:CapA family protein [Fonticella tunisiensis]|uniref:Poly-gamma-glutamate synthesis protein (Capsule biosynthesis protein) n=1 Tax=Fonticella tunisiensis TaxID=1096341 RepID=A0A4R7K9U6_9CLOT|nr:CapA family protein [Fonticella tunisiensis]TDT50950.1 poly-gamma-glutamate synthesis protein (capsule biosynthesis protein) [Fonticella tunisiensis]